MRAHRLTRGLGPKALTVSLGLAFVANTAFGFPPAKRPKSPARLAGVDTFVGIPATHAVAPAALYAALALYVPSFSRQTGLACSACHYQFPQLTPFGRMFKLNGYTLSGLKSIVGGDSTRPSLSLQPIP